MDEFLSYLKDIAIIRLLHPPPPTPPHPRQVRRYVRRALPKQEDIDNLTSQFSEFAQNAEATLVEKWKELEDFIDSRKVKP